EGRAQSTGTGRGQLAGRRPRRSTSTAEGRAQSTGTGRGQLAGRRPRRSTSTAEGRAQSTGADGGQLAGRRPRRSTDGGQLAGRRAAEVDGRRPAVSALIEIAIKITNRGVGKRRPRLDSVQPLTAILRTWASARLGRWISSSPRSSLASTASRSTSSPGEKLRRCWSVSVSARSSSGPPSTVMSSACLGTPGRSATSMNSLSLSNTSTSGYTTVFCGFAVAMIKTPVAWVCDLVGGSGGLDSDLPRLRGGVLGQGYGQHAVDQLGLDVVAIDPLGQRDPARELEAAALAADRLVALGHLDRALGGQLDPVFADRQLERSGLERSGIEARQLGAEGERLLAVLEADLAGLAGEVSGSTSGRGHDRVEQHVHRPEVIGGVEAVHQHDRLLLA